MQRTTIRLDEELMREIKVLAARTGKTFTGIVDDALRRLLAAQRPSTKQQGKFRLITFKGSGLRPGVDLDDSAALMDLMDEEKWSSST